MSTYIIIILAFDVLLAVLVIACLYEFFVNFTRNKKMPKLPDGAIIERKQYEIMMKDGQEWIKSNITSEHEIISFDGLKLKAEFIHNPQSKGTVICVHGFKSSGYFDFGMSARSMYEKGYSILLVHNRAHGKSEGKFITLGIKERFDVKQWAEYVEQNMGAGKPIYLLGLSMGAASVLMSTGLGLPESVKAIFADSGFDSAYNQVKYMAKTSYKLPAFPALYIIEGIFYIVNGFSLRSADNGELLKNCDIPIMFIHGKADKFVPYSMCERNFEDCRAPKVIVSAKEAGHGETYLWAKEEYTKNMDEFLDKYK